MYYHDSGGSFGNGTVIKSGATPISGIFAYADITVNPWYAYRFDLSISTCHQENYLFSSRVLIPPPLIVHAPSDVNLTNIAPIISSYLPIHSILLTHAHTPTTPPSMPSSNPTLTLASTLAFALVLVLALALTRAFVLVLALALALLASNVPPAPTLSKSPRCPQVLILTLITYRS